MPLKPTRPVPRGLFAGRFRGRYKVGPEDFEVEEVPAYEPAGAGEHVWLWVEKRGLSTLDLLAEIGRALGRPPRDLGVAGLKDARSVSRQWVSVHGASEAAAGRIGGERWRVLAASRHGNKLRTGHLRGNRFRITLRGVAPGDLELARRSLAELERTGVPNYFGEQRFGKRGANLDKGLRILAGPARAMAQRMPRRVFGLCISAVQSEVFNRVVVRRLPGLGTLLPGDLAFLHRNGACFPVPDPAAEQARADAFEISPTGPLHGPEMPQPAGEPASLEREALEGLGLSPEHFADLPFGLGRGERRPLRVPIEAPAAEESAEGLVLTFALPRGCFATTVLRELLVETPWFAEG